MLRTRQSETAENKRLADQHSRSLDPRRRNSDQVVLALVLSIGWRCTWTRARDPSWVEVILDDRHRLNGSARRAGRRKAFDRVAAFLLPKSLDELAHEFNGVRPNLDRL